MSELYIILSILISLLLRMALYISPSAAGYSLEIKLL